ncbi:hypothetical protein V6N13_121251 [Hibiscus sabdariffa]
MNTPILVLTLYFIHKNIRVFLLSDLTDSVFKLRALTTISQKTLTSSFLLINPSTFPLEFPLPGSSLPFSIVLIKK